LLDITSAAKCLSSYIEGITRDVFLGDDKTKAAVVR